MNTGQTKNYTTHTCVYARCEAMNNAIIVHMVWLTNNVLQKYAHISLTWQTTSTGGCCASKRRLARGGKKKKQMHTKVDYAILRKCSIYVGDGDR